MLPRGEKAPNAVRLSRMKNPRLMTLTGVGLCALMLRAGLPVPAAEGSRLPIYLGVSSAIGDAQDVSFRWMQKQRPADIAVAIADAPELDH